MHDGYNNINDDLLTPSCFDHLVALSLSLPFWLVVLVVPVADVERKCQLLSRAMHCIEGGGEREKESELPW